MKKRGIHEAFPIVATALGRRFGVSVEFGGDEAKTDGQRIYLPALDLDTDAKDAAWGFLCHECSHVRFTDWQQWKRATSSPLRAQMTNAAEDIRIEQLITQEYPGTKGMLDKALDHVMDAGYLQPPGTDEGLPSLVFKYVLATMRYEHLGQERLAETARGAGEALETHLSSGVRARLDVLLQQGGTLASTKEAVQLADRLIKVLEEAEQEARERADRRDQGEQGAGGGNQSAGASSDSPNDGDSDQGGGDDSADPGDQSASGSDSSQQSSGSAPSGDGQSGASQGSDSQADSDSGGENRPSDRELSDALQSVLQAAEADIGKDLGSQLAEQLEKAGEHENRRPSGCNVSPSRTVVRASSDRSRVPYAALDNSRQLQARLKGLVQASQRRRPMTGRRGKRIDGTRVWRIGVGDPRVLRRETDRRAPNAAVHVLIDQSSSMSNRDPQHLAMSAAVSLSAALYEIRGVNPGVSSFPYSGDNGISAQIVRHGQSPRRMIDRFWHGPNGQTPMAEAMMASLIPLLEQPEERKLLIVVTDGAPNGRHGPSGVAELNRRCELSGVEVVGIGIGVDLSHLFHHWISIQEVGQLRDRLFDLAQRSLVTAA